MLNRRFQIVRNAFARLPISTTDDKPRLNVVRMLSEFQHLNQMFQSAFGFLICLNQIFDSLTIIMVMFLFLLQLTTKGLFPYVEVAVVLYIGPPLLKNAIIVWAVSRLGDQVFINLFLFQLNKNSNLSLT